MLAIPVTNANKEIRLEEERDYEKILFQKNNCIIYGVTYEINERIWFPCNNCRCNEAKQHFREYLSIEVLA